MKRPLHVDAIPGVALDGRVFRFALVSRRYDPKTGEFTGEEVQDLLVPRDVVFATINRICLALFRGGRRVDLEDLRRVEASLRAQEHG